MPALTPEPIANFPLSRYANLGSIQRGRAYYKDNRVWDADMVNAGKAVLIVNGDSGEYTVEIEVSKKPGELLFECDCPYADEGNFCKHMVAASMALKDYLEDGEELEGDYEDEDDEEAYIVRKPVPPPPAPARNWEKRLGETLALTPRRSTSPNLTWYAAVVLLTRL